MPDIPVQTGTRVFVSNDHPGRVSWQWAFTTALIRPLAVCILPVMIGAVLAVLQGSPALFYLLAGLPLAMFAAMAWTAYRLYTLPVEVHVTNGGAAIRTAWASLHRQPLVWQPIMELRTNRGAVSIGIGDATYDLSRDRWADAETLLQTLKTARDTTVPLS